MESQYRAQLIIGSRIQCLAGPERGLTGTVISIVPGSNREDHGRIEVRLDNGTIEHFVHFEWHKSAKLIT